MERPTTSHPSGSPVPFDRVVEDHGGTVWRVCRALLGPTDADDAWSATFLAALRAYDRLRPGSDVRAWLVTIAHRKAVDLLRSRSRVPVPVGAVAEVPATTDRPRCDEHDPALWAAVDALPPRQRTAVALHHVAGLPYADVGRMTGTTEAAARRAAADGIAALRRRLDPSTPSPDPTPEVL